MSSGDLYDLFKKQPKLFTDEFIKNLALQIAKAIKYIHMRNIIHRDIKMENFLLKNNIIKLGDFGWTVHVLNKKPR